jgi:hypothetical protein
VCSRLAYRTMRLRAHGWFQPHRASHKASAQTIAASTRTRVTSNRSTSLTGDPRRGWPSYQPYRVVSAVSGSRARWLQHSCLRKCAPSDLPRPSLLIGQKPIRTWEPTHKLRSAARLHLNRDTNPRICTSAIEAGYGRKFWRLKYKYFVMRGIREKEMCVRKKRQVMHCKGGKDRSDKYW